MGATPTLQQRGYTILYVDDSEASPESADRLEREDDRFSVTRVATAEAALDALEGENVDCVVSEYGLPDASGVDFLQRVRSEYPELPFLLFTDSEDVAGEAISAGVTDYVRKRPGDDDYALLADRVNQAVSRYHAQRQVDLEEATQLLDQLFTEVPTSLYVKDAEGRHLWISGYNSTREEVIGKTDLELYDEELAEGSYRDDMTVIETGEPIHNKEEYNPEIDEWTLTSKVPWYGDDGEIKGLIGITRFITEKKQYERELERQNERLEQFASMVSHDLRNPLNVATGHLDLVAQDYESEHLDAARTALERMATLIDDLLALAHQGQPIDEREEVVLSSIVDRCWDVVETSAATLRIESDATVMADSARLRQFFENLFRNAIEHAGEDVAVSVGALEDRPGFYVADDGPGIPEDERDVVFESGYSTAAGGTGFGLAIVSEIVDAHGWEIRVTESEDGGARFQIEGVDVVES